VDALALELIDAIIDYIPPHDANPCSLVATHWRKRSQQHYLSRITFSGEEEVVRWCANIPQDPAGIPSYVQGVEFRRFRRWLEPTVIGRALKNLRHVRTLTIKETNFSHSSIHEAIASSGFGSELISLILGFSPVLVSVSTQLISLFPKLRELEISGLLATSVSLNKTDKQDVLRFKKSLATSLGSSLRH
jgi:hypothetical protein